MQKQFVKADTKVPIASDELSAPILSPIANRTVDEAKILHFMVSASDSDFQDLLTFSLAGRAGLHDHRAKTRLASGHD